MFFLDSTGSFLKGYEYFVMITGDYGEIMMSDNIFFLLKLGEF